MTSTSAIFEDHFLSLPPRFYAIKYKAESYKETLNAYLRFVNDYGPDDYFSLKKLIEQHFDSLTVRDILATLRLSGYDARIFGQMLPRLHELLPDISDNERWGLFQASHRIWDTYYPLGEEMDMAFALGQLLFALAFHQEAIAYFQLSLKIYGEDGGTLYNIALCHALLDQVAEALEIVEPLSAQYPDDEALEALHVELSASRSDVGTVQATV